jgi:hypothetical protein
LQVGAQAPVADDGAARFFDPAIKSLILPRGGGMSCAMRSTQTRSNQR